MFAALLLVFREVLEAALIVTIVLAVTRGVPGRGKWVLAGIAAGVVGAIVVALFAESIANAMEGMGQEVFNAGVLLLAVAMLAWHAIWMSSHGRELAAQMKAIGGAVAQRTRPPSVLIAVVALAVLREGSEVVLFMYGLSAGGTSVAAQALGSGLGLGAGIAVGVLLYFGLLSIPMRHFFTVTNWMVVFLAAGMAGQAANYLVQADWLPVLKARMWDTSWLLTNHSDVGNAMRALVGYDAQPTGIQVAFWVGTAVLIVLGMKFLGKPKTAKVGSPQTA
ncbi:MAG TPA: FTR1 family protein [Xanthomonadales bacterium]|nr:FTR1 family protein [Xanthomonadales bacterium]